MYINKDWRVLTVGDGDLSFSFSLASDYALTRLTASVLDDKDTVTAKYAENAISSLHNLHIPVFFGLDLLNPHSFAIELKQQFDLVIFQFPLIPQNKDRQEYQLNRQLGNNVLNRQLIWQFLHQSFSYFCDPNGAQLVYITSKNVKPYSDWNIENLCDIQGVDFLGEMPFKIDRFPSYRLRNVDRDKMVKSTQAITYVWGMSAPLELNSHLTISKKHLPDHCNLCGKGPLVNDQQRIKHQSSALHKRLSSYQIKWLEAQKRALK